EYRKDARAHVERVARDIELADQVQSVVRQQAEAPLAPLELLLGLRAHGDRFPEARKGLLALGHVGSEQERERAEHAHQQLEEQQALLERVEGEGALA